MKEHIQVRDLIEMLERIEDKSARIILQVENPVLGSGPAKFTGDIDSIKKTSDRQYTIFGV